MDNFNLRLRDAMTALKISAKDLATQTGVDHTTVNVWLRGECSPCLKNREKIVSFFEDNGIKFSGGTSPYAKIKSIIQSEKRTEPICESQQCHADNLRVTIAITDAIVAITEMISTVDALYEYYPSTWLCDASRNLLNSISDIIWINGQSK